LENEEDWTIILVVLSKNDFRNGLGEWMVGTINRVEPADSPNIREIPVSNNLCGTPITFSVLFLTPSMLHATAGEVN
jgi:hypothetical protein